MKLLLKIMQGGNLPGGTPYQKHFFGKGETLGRDPGCDMVLPCNEKMVSRTHAKILLENDAFVVLDSSANGVFINDAGEPIGQGSTRKIQDGDTIRVGDYQLLANIVVEPVAKKTSATPRPAASGFGLDAGLGNRGSAKIPEESAAPNGAINGHQKKPAGDVIRKNPVNIGNTSDHFLPPSAVIPQDWNLDVAITPDAPIKTPRESVKASTIKFTNQEVKLLERFLNGLGGEKLVSPEEITPETMLLAGRVLRVCVNGVLNQRKLLQESKSSLSLDELTTDRQMESDALADISSTDQFFKVLLDPHHKSQASLPQDLAASFKQQSEDQNDIFTGIQFAIDKLKEGLSPKTIETAYQNSQRSDKSSSAPISQLSSKFLTNARLWLFYRNYWEKLCNNINVQIRKHFESKFLLAHAKRMRDKNING